MSKLVKIYDRKPMEIFVGRKTRGPIVGIRLDESIIGRLLRSVDAPRDIYAMGPNNKSVRLTLDNYMVPENELFEVKVEAVKPNTFKNAIQDAINESSSPVDTNEVKQNDTEVKSTDEGYNTVALGGSSNPEEDNNDSATNEKLTGVEITVSENMTLCTDNVTGDDIKNIVNESVVTVASNDEAPVQKPNNQQYYNKNKNRNNYKK